MMKVNILETDTGRILEDELRDWSQAALNQLDKAGYKSFRPGQLEAVNTILNDRDLIAVMPTGSGKSVCYQLPAMREGHLALVVSPLRALMRDQVQALQARGVAAALIDSGVTPKQRQSIYAMAHGGGLRILYVAPERLFADDFLFFSQSTRIDLIAVDEAHCVLQWGHDFRPNYLKIGEFIAGLPTRPVVAAFTATATRRQVPEIAHALGLDNPIMLGTGFDRPNIRFDTIELKPAARKKFITNWAKAKQGSGIVYCTTIRRCDELAEILREAGIDAMQRYCETDECLRRVLLDYFGEDQDREHCDNCGNCTYVADCDVDPQELRRKSRSTRARRGGKTGKGRKTAKHAEGETEKEPQPYEPKPEDKAIVSFVAGRQKLLGRGFGDRKTIHSLWGGTGEDIDDQGLDQVDGYGELAGMDEQTIKDRIETLVAAGILKRGVYHTLLDGKETES